MASIRFGDLGQLFDGPHATPKRQSQGPHFLNIASLVDGRLDLAQSDHVSSDDFVRWTKRVTPAEGDLLFSYETRLGDAALMPGGVKACLGRRMALLRPNRQVVDPRFLLYYYLSPVFRTIIDRYTIHGATVNRIGLSTMGSWPIAIPELKEQRAIAEVLGALDDKIAANVKMASITEDLLHASFRAGVSVGSCDLVRVEDIVRRLQIPRRFRKDEILAVGDFPVLDQSEDGMLGFLNGDKFIEATEDAPVLYFGDHTCKLRISSEKFLVGPNTIPFIGAGVPSVVLFCALQGLQPQEEYQRHWQSLMKKETSIPDPIWCADFASKFKVFLTLLASAKRENSILGTTRDSLLPQMMSGKIRVRDVEQMVGDVV